MSDYDKEDANAAPGLGAIFIIGVAALFLVPLAMISYFVQTTARPIYHGAHR